MLYEEWEDRAPLVFDHHKVESYNDTVTDNNCGAESDVDDNENKLMNNVVQNIFKLLQLDKLGKSTNIYYTCIHMCV